MIARGALSRIAGTLSAPCGGVDSAIRVLSALALPPPSPSDLRRGGRAGARRAYADQRGGARSRPPRLPVRGLARHGQALDGEDPRGLPELRPRPDRRALRRV